MTSRFPTQKASNEEIVSISCQCKHSGLAHILCTDPAINSLAPEGFESYFTSVFFKLILWFDILSTFCGTGLRWMPQNPIDDKSALVWVMACCHQATNNYLSQCWPKSMSPYGITKPQWVKVNMKQYIKCCLGKMMLYEPVQHNLMVLDDSLFVDLVLVDIICKIVVLYPPHANQTGSNSIRQDQYVLRPWIMCRNSFFAPYRKTSSISRTKSQNLNVSCIFLQLSSLNPLKPGVKLRMKM